MSLHNCRTHSLGRRQQRSLQRWLCESGSWGASRRISRKNKGVKRSPAAKSKLAQNTTHLHHSHEASRISTPAVLGSVSRFHLFGDNDIPKHQARSVANGPSCQRAFKTLCINLTPWSCEKMPKESQTRDRRPRPRPMARATISALDGHRA